MLDLEGKYIGWNCVWARLLKNYRNLQLVARPCDFALLPLMTPEQTLPRKLERRLPSMCKSKLHPDHGNLRAVGRHGVLPLAGRHLSCLVASPKCDQSRFGIPGAAFLLNHFCRLT